MINNIPALITSFVILIILVILIKVAIHHWSRIMISSQNPGPTNWRMNETLPPLEFSPPRDHVELDVINITRDLVTPSEDASDWELEEGDIGLAK